MRDFARSISRRELYGLLDVYQPNPSEIIPEGPGFTRKNLNYALLHRRRWFWTINCLLKYSSVKQNPAFLDCGIFPGTLLRIVSLLLGRQNCRLHGVGLKISPAFKLDMENAGIKVEQVNLDPANADLRAKNHPTTLPFEDGSMDLVLATEIIEHMENPNHLLSQAQRVLCPGGHILITTPNVSRIGSVFKLLAGKSNYDRLKPVGFSNAEDEWRPHFREYSLEELHQLLRQNGFEPVEHIFSGDVFEFHARDAKHKLGDWLKRLFWPVPHLREEILLVGQKP